MDGKVIKETKYSRKKEVSAHHLFNLCQMRVVCRGHNKGRFLRRDLRAKMAALFFKGSFSDAYGATGGKEWRYLKKE